MAVKVELRNGCVGWGEAPVLPGVTAEDQDGALTKGKEVCDVVMSYGGDGRGMTLGMVLEEVGRVLPGHRFASVSSLSFSIGFECDWLGFRVLFGVIGAMMRGRFAILMIIVGFGSIHD